MSDGQVPLIDALDPLVPHYTRQYFLRERFLHALQEMVEVLDGPGSGAEKLTKLTKMVSKAVDEQDIERFIAEGYPCPWLPDDPDAVILTETVVRSLRSQGIV